MYEDIGAGAYQTEVVGDSWRAWRRAAAARHDHAGKRRNIKVSRARGLACVHHAIAANQAPISAATPLIIVFR